MQLKVLIFIKIKIMKYISAIKSERSSRTEWAC